MRVIAFVVMVALAVASVLEGSVALAVVFGGVKALIVGLAYMELRDAARPHALGFAAGMVALTGVLLALLWG